MKTIIILTIALLLIGCTSGENLDGKILKDSNGDLFLVSHNLGDNYTLRKLSNIEEFLLLNKAE